jgi:hypothetical protein
LESENFFSGLHTTTIIMVQDLFLAKKSEGEQINKSGLRYEQYLFDNQQ